MSAVSANEPRDLSKAKWIAYSDDVGSLEQQQPTSMSTEVSDNEDADDEVRRLRQLLLEKTVAVETLRSLLQRSDHCHRMSIAGLSKCITQQQQLLQEKQAIIAQNETAIADLNDRFAHDAKFTRETLNKYLDDTKPPSAALQGEIAPGLHVVQQLKEASGSTELCGRSLYVRISDADGADA